MAIICEMGSRSEMIAVEDRPTDDAEQHRLLLDDQ